MKGRLDLILEEFLLVAALVLCVVQSATADEDKYYVGLSIGQSKAKDACAGLDPSSGFIGNCKDTDTAYKVYGGAHFTKNWGGEIAYVDFGKSTADGTFSGIPASARTKVNGLVLDAMGTLPLSDQFSVFGKLGVLGWHIDSNATLSGFGSSSISSSGSSLTYGIGAQFDFTKAFGVRAEWEYFDKVGDNSTGKSAIELGSIGIVYRF
jgi:OmpA-OmpF porin, OOP family